MPDIVGFQISTFDEHTRAKEARITCMAETILCELPVSYVVMQTFVYTGNNLMINYFWQNYNFNSFLQPNISV